MRGHLRSRRPTGSGSRQRTRPSSPRLQRPPTARRRARWYAGRRGLRARPRTHARSRRSPQRTPRGRRRYQPVARRETARSSPSGGFAAFAMCVEPRACRPPRRPSARGLATALECSLRRPSSSRLRFRGRRATADEGCAPHPCRRGPSLRARPVATSREPSARGRNDAALARDRARRHRAARRHATHARIRGGPSARSYATSRAWTRRPGPSRTRAETS